MIWIMFGRCNCCIYLSGTPAVLNTTLNNSNPENSATPTAYPPLTSNMPELSIIVVMKSCTPKVPDIQIRFNYRIDFQPANQHPLVLDNINAPKYPLGGVTSPETKNFWPKITDTTNARYSFELPQIV